MTKTGFALAAALMLSGASGVYAQAGPPDKNSSPQAEGKAPAPTDKAAATESMKGDAAPSQMERRVDEQTEPKGDDGKKSGKSADKDKDGKGDKQDRQAEDRKDNDKAKTGANDKSDDKGSSKGAAAKDQDSKNSDKAKGADAKDKDGDKTKGAEAKDSDKSKQPDAKADNKATDKDTQKSTSTTDSKDVPATGEAAKNAQAKDAAKTGQPNNTANTAATPPSQSGKEPNVAAQAQQTSDRKDAAAAKSVQLTGEKKERVRTAFKDKPSVKHITNVEINVSVGTRAPSSWEYADVPIVVIETVPEYRGYRYAWVADHYVIVEPATYEIVAVIDAPGGRADASSSSSGSGRGSRCADLSLNDDDRAFILRSVEIKRGVTINGVELGWSVPDSIELRSFPDPVITRSAMLGSCRYFVVEDRIAIVDPDADKVVLLIDNRR